jgi:hypothetical protein
MKISVLSLLLIAAVFAVTLLTGCDEGMQMMKPAMEKPDEEKDIPSEPAPMPTVVSITHYGDPTRVVQLGKGLIGEVFYTEVVFSDNVPLVIADDETARPDIRLVVGPNEIPFHIVSHEVSGEDFQSGDCKPVEENRVFLCKFVIPEDVVMTVSVKATTENDMLQSASIRVSRPDTPLPVDLGIPPPP